jgi:hypothetical protein
MRSRSISRLCGKRSLLRAADVDAVGFLVPAGAIASAVDAPGATDEADTVVGADNITLDLTRNQAKLAAIHPWVLLERGLRKPDADRIGDARPDPQ